MLASKHFPEVSLGLYFSDREYFLTLLRKYVTNFGGFLLSNSGVDPILIQKAIHLGREVFSLRKDQKDRYTLESCGRLTGYVSLGDSGLEMWHVARESQIAPTELDFYAPNVWPEESPEFASVTKTLFQRFDQLSCLLIQCIFESLALDIRQILPDLAPGWSTLRVLGYPSHQKELEVPAGPEHSDFTLLTLLPGGTEEGLQGKIEGAGWVSIPIESNQLFVGIGRLLEILTSGSVRAFQHRVVLSAELQRQRVSVPFFMIPRPSRALTPLKEYRELDPLDESNLTVGSFIASEISVGYS